MRLLGFSLFDFRMVEPSRFQTLAARLLPCSDEFGAVARSTDT
jgi:hypothetical protein